MKLGTKVKLLKPWRAYSAGTVLEQGFEVDLGDAGAGRDRGEAR
jgi:hypothetical protein